MGRTRRRERFTSDIGGQGRWIVILREDSVDVLYLASVLGFVLLYVYHSIGAD